MKLKDKEIWLKLYDVAEKIKEIEPWKYLSDADLFKFISEELKDDFYFCVMGQAGMHTAVSVYSSSQIDKYFALLKNDYPSSVSMNYQECLICQFLDREKTLLENRKIIKELGLKFRGIWISFENFEKGYEPRTLNIDQVEKLTILLENFYEMIKEYIENKINIDFDNEEIFIRSYNTKINRYVNKPGKIGNIEIQYKHFFFDVKFEEEVKKLPQKNMEFEYEFLNYLPIRIKEMVDKERRQYYPRVRSFAIRNSEFVLPPKLIDKKDYKTEMEYINESIDQLLKFIFKLGRPKTIYVRDDETKYLLNDIAKKANIELKVSPRLKTIDQFYKMIETMMQ